MRIAPALHGVNEAEVVRAGPDVGHHVAHPFATLAVSAELPRTFEDGTALAIERDDGISTLYFGPVVLG